MSPHDSDNATVSSRADTELADAYEGADRITRKYEFPLKLGAMYAAVIAVGYVIHLVSSSQFVNTIGTLLVYFTIMFAGVSALIGVLFWVTAAVRSQ